MNQNHEEHPRTTARLSTEVTAEDLAELRFFEGLPGWARERLAASATRRGFEQGAIVVRQNDEARGVYFLLSCSPGRRRIWSTSRAWATS